MNGLYRILLFAYNLLIFLLAFYSTSQSSSLLVQGMAVLQMLGTMEVLVGIIAHHGKIELFGLTMQIGSFIGLSIGLVNEIRQFAMIGGILITVMLVSRWVRLISILREPNLTELLYVGDK